MKEFNFFIIALLLLINFSFISAGLTDCSIYGGSSCEEVATSTTSSGSTNITYYINNTYYNITNFVNQSYDNLLLTNQTNNINTTSFSFVSGVLNFVETSLNPWWNSQFRNYFNQQLNTTSNVTFKNGYFTGKVGIQMDVPTSDLDVNGSFLVRSKNGGRGLQLYPNNFDEIAMNSFSDGGSQTIGYINLSFDSYGFIFGGAGSSTATAVLTAISSSSRLAGLFEGSVNITKNLTIAGGVYMLNTSQPNPLTNYLIVHSFANQGIPRLEADSLFTINGCDVLNRDNCVVVKNTDGTSLTIGTPVYTNGAVGINPTVAKANANSISTLPILGLVVNNTLVNNGFGLIMTKGILSNVDTSLWTAGTVLYVNTTSGTLTNIRPSYPNLANRVGTVMVSNINNGQILVEVAPFVGGLESGTTNTNYTFAGNITILGNYMYNGTDRFSFADLNKTTDISGLTNYWGSNGSNIFNETAYVGIGTTSPSNTLDVRGSGNFSGTVYVNNKTNLLPPTCSGNDKLTFDGTSFSCSADVLGTSGSGIIASGNNVNGSYIKFADGTMIEWGNITQTTSSSSSNQFGTTSGTSYSVSNLITYPVAFVSTPTVVGSVSDPSFGSAWVTLLGVTPSNFISQLWSALNGLGRTVGWTAIGRWTTLTNITQNTTSWAVNGNGDTVLFDTTKKVGIGTNNPSSKLEVVGNVNITGNLTLGIGKIMYNTSANNYIYYNTTDWATFGTGTSSSSGIPAGMIAPFNSASCPTGWILADGTSGTPDLRGIFIRGSGASGSMKYANGSYYNIGQGTYGNDSIQDHVHQATAYSGNLGINPYMAAIVPSTVIGTWSSSGPAAGSAGVPRTGVENRPAYYATVYCVKTAEDTPVSNTIWGTSGNTILVNNQSMNLSLSNTSTIYYAPNSSEPSAGTLHFKYTQNILNGATIGVGQNVSVDFSPYVPVGTTAILAEVYMNPGAPCYVTFGANKGDRDTISLNYGSAYVSNHVTFRLNSTRGAYVMNPSSGYSTGATFYLNLNGYYT